MDDAAEGRKILIGHVAPFGVWIAVILLLELVDRAVGFPRGLYPWVYALKSVACAGLFLWFRPWRVYPGLSRASLPLALLVGVGVALIWILPETPWVGRVAPGFQLFYHRWLIMMPGTLPDYFDPALRPPLPWSHPSRAYSPAEAGWILTLARIAGSAGVIAVVEEFFFRGFFYRWLLKSRFWTVPLRLFDAHAFWVVVAVFALEHDRWLAGAVAGIAYGWLTLRTGDIWAVALSHALTNLLLGAYVAVSGQYGFW